MKQASPAWDHWRHGRLREGPAGPGRGEPSKSLLVGFCRFVRFDSSALWLAGGNRTLLIPPVARSPPGQSLFMSGARLFMSEKTRSGNRSASVLVRKDALRKPERVCSCPERRAPKTGARLVMSEKTRSEVRSASVHVRRDALRKPERVCSCPERVCSCPNRRAPETGARLFMSEETRTEVRSASVHVRRDALRKPECVCSCPERVCSCPNTRLFMSEKTRSGNRSVSVHVHKHIYFCDPNPARVLGHLQPSLREGSDIRSEMSLNQLPDSSSATQDPSRRWAALEELGG